MAVAIEYHRVRGEISNWAHFLVITGNNHIRACIYISKFGTEILLSFLNIYIYIYKIMCSSEEHDVVYGFCYRSFL